MALFKKDSKNETAAVAQDLSWVIKAPHITEKAAMISAENKFTFIVASASNKVQIKKAIIEKYGVTPLSINVINQSARKEVRRGKKVHKKGMKKAVVTLKQGDTIELA